VRCGNEISWTVHGNCHGVHGGGEGGRRRVCIGKVSLKRNESEEHSSHVNQLAKISRVLI
jgi:hypothetical protein